MHKFFCRYIFKRGFRAVDEDLSVMDFHCFTGKSDDAFNKKLLFVIRVSEDNDIEPFRFAEYISKPVSENTVSGHDRILHRTGRNFRIYKDKTVDAKGNDNCDCECQYPVEEFVFVGRFLFRFE